MAAFLACGMDGLAKGLDMPPETTGDPANAVEALLMPKTLSEALDFLAEDEVLAEMLGEQGMLFHQLSRKWEIDFMSKLSFQDQVKLYIQKF